MKAVLKLYVDGIECGVCGSTLYVGHNSIRCLNLGCPEYKIKYKHPKVELERLKEEGKK